MFVISAKAKAAKAAQAKAAALSTVPGSSYVNPEIAHFDSQSAATKLQAAKAKAALANGQQIQIDHYDPTTGTTDTTNMYVEPASGGGFNAVSYSM